MRFWIAKLASKPKLLQFMDRGNPHYGGPIFKVSLLKPTRDTGSGSLKYPKKARLGHVGITKNEELNEMENLPKFERKMFKQEVAKKSI